MKLFKRKNIKQQEIDLEVECRVLIDSGDFQKNILEYVSSEEFDKMFNNTHFATLEDRMMYRQAMLHGVVFASLLTCKCDKVLLRLNKESGESK